MFRTRETLLSWVLIEKLKKEMDTELDDDEVYMNMIERLYETFVIDEKLSFGNEIKYWCTKFGADPRGLGTEFEKTIVFHGYSIRNYSKFQKSIKCSENPRKFNQ